MTSSHYRMRLLTVLFICLLLYLPGCTKSSEPKALGGVSIKEPSMNTAKARFDTPTIPPIDTDIPLELQTATFGLG